RASGRTTRAMAVEAIRKAILDAGLKAAAVDGMLDYQGGDSTLANSVASDLGIRFNFYMDVMGGGSSTEALVGLAMGAIEAGMWNTGAVRPPLKRHLGFPLGRAAGPARAPPSRYEAWTWRRCRTACAAPARTSRRPSCATCTSTGRPPRRSPTCGSPTASTPRRTRRRS